MALAIDQDLLARATEGDSTALGDLLAQAAPHIERQLTRYPLSDDDKLDLLQITMMQVVRRLGSFRGDSSFSTWLFRVTANEALMMMRSQRRHRARMVEGLEVHGLDERPQVVETESPSLEETSSRRQLDQQVRSALSDLSDEYRDVVVAHYHLDLSLQEIADRFSLTESAVRSRLHRARARLRGLLEANASVGEMVAAA